MLESPSANIADSENDIGPTPLILHHNDHDGQCAAAIAVDFEREQGHRTCECRSINYDNFMTTYQNQYVHSLLKTPGRRIYLLDFNPRPFEMAEFIAVIGDWQPRLFWIDHHEKAQTFDYFNLPIRGLRAFHQSACANAWNFLFPQRRLPDVVKYVSQNDMGHCDLDGFTGDLHFYLTHNWVEISNPQSLLWMQLLSGDIYSEKIKADGYRAKSIISRFFAKVCKEAGFVTALNGHSCFALNGNFFDSQLLCYLKKSYGIVCKFGWAGTCFSITLYSDKVDVGEICLGYGGGGHPGAAGFVTETLPEFLNIGGSNE